MTFPILTILIALTAANSIVCSLGDLNPKTPNSGSQQLQVTFHNPFGYAVELCWSDYEGLLKRESTIEPDQKRVVTTYVGHIWSLREPGAECAGKQLSGYGSYNEGGDKELSDFYKCPMMRTSK